MKRVGAGIKKGIGISAVISVLFFLMFFPQGNKAPDDGKIHLDYWFVTGQKEEIPYPVRRFNEMQDSIVVEATAIPWQEAEKKILTAILSGHPPDVFDQFVPVVKWASRMGLVPLDRWLEKEDFDSSVFFPSLWKEMHWQGHVFAIPVATASFALYYNKRLFREAGLDPEKPPRTWDAVRKMNSRLIKRDRKNRLVQIGYIFHLGNQLKVSQQADDTPHLMAFQKNVPFLSEDGTTVQFATRKMADIVNWIIAAQGDVRLQELQAFTAGFGYGDQHAFISERVAMMVMGSNFVDNIRRYKPDLEYGVSIIPSFEGTPSASTTGSWWMAIPRGSENKEAAWNFISFCARKETQLGSLRETDESLFPANRLAAADTSFMKSERDRIFYRQMFYAHSTAVVPMAHDAFWREYYSAVERAVHGKQSAFEALKQAETIIQGELDDALEYDRYVRSHMTFEEMY